MNTPPPDLDREVLAYALERIEAGELADAAALIDRFPGRKAAARRVAGALGTYRRLLADARGTGGGPDPLAGGPGAGTAAAETGEPGEPLPPDIPDYRITGLLGQGAMGRVWLARQRSLAGREVALKVLHPHLAAGDPRFAARFRREAALASTVRSPHVAQVYAFGEQGATLWYAMERIAGPTLEAELARLRTLAHRGELDPTAPAYRRTVVTRVAAVAAALGAVHHRGMVHRDVKPANILLRRPPVETDSNPPPLAGTPVLVDFGLARPVEGSELTGRQTLLHTPAYAAPEARLGRRLDARADVYSLGRVLHDLLTLAPPPATDPPPGDPGCPDPIGDRRLAAVVAMALQENPVHRYSGGDPLHRELTRWLAGRPLRARPSSPLGRAVLAARRDPLGALRRTAKAAALALLLLCLVGLSWQVAATYRRAGRADRALAAGRLAEALAAWRRLGATPTLTGVLPGLEGARQRVADLAADPELARLTELLADPDPDRRRRGRLTLHRYLFTDRLAAWREGLRRFLLSEIETWGPLRHQELPRARAGDAAVALANYGLRNPAPFPPDKRGALTRRTEAVLLRALEAERRAPVGWPYRRRLLGALNGVIGRAGLDAATEQLEAEDVESRRLACANLTKGLLRARQAGAVTALVDRRLLLRIARTAARVTDQVRRRRWHGPLNTLNSDLLHLLVLCNLALTGDIAPLEPTWYRLHPDGGPRVRPVEARRGAWHPSWEKESPAWMFIHVILDTFRKRETLDGIYDDIWSDASGPSAPGHRKRAGSPAAASLAMAGCRFPGKDPILEGSATALTWWDINHSDARAQDGIGYRDYRFFICNRPGRSRLELAARVPAGTRWATLRTGIVPSIRGPLPWGGTCRIRITLPEWDYSVTRVVSMKTNNLDPFATRVQVPQGGSNRTVTLRFEVLEGNTICRLQRLRLEFDKLEK